MKPNNKRKKLNNKKLLMKVFVNLLNKFWVIKLRKFKLVTDLLNHLAHLSLASTDGQPTWKES